MDRLLSSPRAISPTKLDESRKNGIREITGSRACFHREKNVEPSATKRILTTTNTGNEDRHDQI